LTRDPKRFLGKSPHLARHAAVAVLGGDVVDFAYPTGRFPFVIHAATEPPIEPDTAHPLGAFPKDIDGMRRVLEFARTHGVRRFLFTSWARSQLRRQPPR
jgi:dTDP-glucose 4,6-dehydratase